MVGRVFVILFFLLRNFYCLVLIGPLFIATMIVLVHNCFALLFLGRLLLCGIEFVVVC
jgi:hypothetical protein